jgi:capsular polysaccharide biosynthesis protein
LGLSRGSIDLTVMLRAERCPVSEQQLDLARSARLIRDHWQTCLVLVLLGVATAIGFLIVRPALYTATSEVLLPASPASTNANGQATQQDDTTTAGQIATSAGVLTPAGQKVDPSLSLSTLKGRVHAEGVATNVLSITASGSNGPQAEALANAVAAQLVSFETSTNSVTDQSALAGLQTEANQLNKQISSLNAEIAAANDRINGEGSTSIAGRQDAALVASLTTQLDAVALQLNTVNGQLAEAKLGNLATNQGTEVIQNATTFMKPSILHETGVGVFGAVVGFLVGVLFVLIRNRRDHRLHRRDEIADAVGVPVLVSMTTPRRRQTVSDWIELIKQYNPSAADRWRIRQALRDLELKGTPANLTIVVLSGDRAALAAAPQVAIVLSSLGVPTDFVLKASHEFATRMRTACHRLSLRGVGPRPNLQVWNGPPTDEAESPAVVVTCIVVDASQPKLPLVQAVGTTLLAVTAGFANADHLARVAIAAADSGVPIKGILLTNPDPDDHSTGRFPQVTPRVALAPHVRSLASRGLMA